MASIFISYSHKDSVYVVKLVEALRAERFEVWFDERIEAGSTWPRVIEENLRAAAAMIVVMTPRSRDSEWVMNEFHFAHAQGKPIFPLLLEGEVWLEVAARQYVDVSGDKLPPPKFYAALERIVPRQPAPRQRGKSGAQTAEAERLERERRIAEEAEQQRQTQEESVRVTAAPAEEERQQKAKHSQEARKRRAKQEAERKQREQAAAAWRREVASVACIIDRFVEQPGIAESRSSFQTTDARAIFLREFPTGSLRAALYSDGLPGLSIEALPHRLKAEDFNPPLKMLKFEQQSPIPQYPWRQQKVAPVNLGRLLGETQPTQFERPSTIPPGIIRLVLDPAGFPKKHPASGWLQQNGWTFAEVTKPVFPQSLTPKPDEDAFRYLLKAPPPPKTITAWFKDLVVKFQSRLSVKPSLFVKNTSAADYNLTEELLALSEQFGFDKAWLPNPFVRNADGQWELWKLKT